MFKNQELRIVFEIIVGGLVSSIISSIFIKIGFLNSNRAGMYYIKEFGIPIYKVSKGKGSPIVSNMIFIGIFSSILLVIVIETIIYIKGRNKH